MPNPYSTSEFQPDVYERVRTYGLRSDPIPNKALTDLWQRNIEERNYNLNMNNQTIPSKTKTYIGGK